MGDQLAVPGEQGARGDQPVCRKAGGRSQANAEVIALSAQSNFGLGLPRRSTEFS
jgi:hypothetical protein